MYFRRICESDWRASSVPAAAVIPTPRVSMVDAAVKTSVVVAALKDWWSRRIDVQVCGGADRGRSICGREMK